MNPLSFVAGAGIGAGLMYLLDPQMGRTRRALLRDQALRLGHNVEDAACVVKRDLGNRAAGLLAEGRSWFSGTRPSDAVLVQRARAKIGRCVSHPGSIEVTAHDGRLTLSGPILADEVDCLLGAVRWVPGVTGVESRLEVHQEPGNVPGLQGPGRRTGEWSALLQQTWSPTTRFLVGATGLSLLAVGFTQRAPVACGLGTIGLGLCGVGAATGNVQNLTGRLLKSQGKGSHRQPERQAPAGGIQQPARQFVGEGV